MTKKTFIALADTIIASGPADRYVRTIQQERSDYNNDVLSLRADDIRPLAIMYGMTPEQLLASWREAGVLAS